MFDDAYCIKSNEVERFGERRSSKWGWEQKNKGEKNAHAQNISAGCWEIVGTHATKQEKLLETADLNFFGFGSISFGETNGENTIFESCIGLFRDNING